MRFFCVSLILLFVSSVSVAQETIKLGATLPLTGFGSKWGAEALQGINLAMEEINASGGIGGRKLEVLAEDFGNFDLKRAAGAAAKFVSVDQVTAILTMWSEDTEAVWPIAKSHGVPVVSIAAGKKNLTNGRALLTRVWPSDELLIKALIECARERQGRQAVVIHEQTAYFEDLAELIKENWKKEPGNSVTALAVTQGGSDLAPLLLNAKSLGADTLFIQTSPPILGLALKQAAALGMRVQRFGVVGSDDALVRNTAGSAMDGLIFSKYAPAVTFFQKDYETRFGTPPDIVADASYDAVKVISDVMRRVGTGGTAIDSGLRILTGFPGATGEITINRDGERSSRSVQLFRFDGTMPKLINKCE